MKRIVVGLAAFALIFGSCEKIETACSEDKKAAALVVEFPDSLSSQETYDLEVNYILDNSCGEFDSFEVAPGEQGSVEVTLFTHYEGCNCNLELIERQTVYPIRIEIPGIYEYKFWITDQEWDSHSLKVY